MKKLRSIFWLVVFCKVSYGQDSPQNPSAHKSDIAIHYYPSALLAGDVSFGVEHRFKLIIAQELSFNIKIFQPALYYFDRGFRADYLFKYYLFDGDKFQFSANLSLEYKHIYFRDKKIGYYYSRDTNQQPKILYQTLLEDRTRNEFGLGMACSSNLKLYKHLFIGADIGVYFVKFKETYDYKEILYRDPFSWNSNEPAVPSTYLKQNKNVVMSPLTRLKLSYWL